jgi:hypothetical protein
VAMFRLVLARPGGLCRVVAAPLVEEVPQGADEAWCFFWQEVAGGQGDDHDKPARDVLRAQQALRCWGKDSR